MGYSKNGSKRKKHPLPPRKKKKNSNKQSNVTINELRQNNKLIPKLVEGK